MGSKKQIVKAKRDAYTAGRNMTINQGKSKRDELLEKITTLKRSTVYAQQNGHTEVERAHSYGKKRLAEFDRQVMKALHPLRRRYQSRDFENAFAHLVGDAMDTGACLQDLLDQVISELYGLHRDAIGEFRKEISGIHGQLASLGVRPPSPPGLPPALPKMTLKNDRPPNRLVERIKAGSNNKHYEPGTVYYVADRPRVADVFEARCERKRNKLEEFFERRMERALERIDGRVEGLIQCFEELEAQLQGR